MEVFFTFCTIFILLLGYINFFSQKRVNSTEKILNRTFPIIKWTKPYLSIINGYITLMMLRKEGVKLAEHFLKIYGPSMQIELASVKTVATCDPNLLQKVLSSTNTGHLNKPESIYEALFTSRMKNGLLASNADIWAPHRKAISRSFTYKSFPTYLKFMVDAAKNLVKSASITASKNCEGMVSNAEMKDMIDHHAVKIITQIIMGSESFNLLDAEIEEFHENFKRLKETTLGRFLHPMQMIPLIWKFHPNKRKMDYYLGQCAKFSYKMIDKYRIKDIIKTEEDLEEQQNKFSAGEEMDYSCYCSGSETEEDLGLKPFECLIEQMIKAGCNNEEIADEVSTFLVTGHESILRALDMVTLHLAANPEHQEICRSEIDQFFDANNNKATKDFSLYDFSELKYLERCILESMRITPLVPFFLRRLDTPLEIEKDCFIEAGHSILVMVWGLHRNPDIYPNPSVFDPDRFLPENVKERHPLSFIPFSYGPRNCLGYKVALLEMKVIMTWILRNFEMSTTDTVDDVKILFDATLKPERMYNISFKRRAGINENL